jgi:NAD+ kinase
MTRREVVCVLHHRSVDTSRADRILQSLGADVWHHIREARAEPVTRMLRKTTLVLTMGGDGTFLYGARLAVGAGIPVLGVNLGRLGFLTELQAGGLEDGIRRFFAGDYRVEERTVLHNQLGSQRSLAVNEVMLHRSPSLKLIRFAMSVDGQDIGTIDADGVLVATATGSTAYALALGGPILEPTLADLVLVPMNPFALTVRPIVLAPGAEVRVTLAGNPATVVIDGYMTWGAEENTMLTIRAYRRRLKVVRFSGAEQFYAVLRSKVGWGAPLVPRP